MADRRRNFGAYAPSTKPSPHEMPRQNSANIPRARSSTGRSPRVERRRTPNMLDDTIKSRNRNRTRMNPRPQSTNTSPTLDTLRRDLQQLKSKNRPPAEVPPVVPPRDDPDAHKAVPISQSARSRFNTSRPRSPANNRHRAQTARSRGPINNTTFLSALEKSFTNHNVPPSMQRNMDHTAKTTKSTRPIHKISTNPVKSKSTTKIPKPKPRPKRRGKQSSSNIETMPRRRTYTQNPKRSSIAVHSLLRRRGKADSEVFPGIATYTENNVPPELARDSSPSKGAFPGVRSFNTNQRPEGLNSSAGKSSPSKKDVSPRKQRAAIKKARRKSLQIKSKFNHSWARDNSRSADLVASATPSSNATSNTQPKPSSPNTKSKKPLKKTKKSSRKNKKPKTNPKANTPTAEEPESEMITSVSQLDTIEVDENVDLTFFSDSILNVFGLLDEAHGQGIPNGDPPANQDENHLIDQDNPPESNTEVSYSHDSQSDDNNYDSDEERSNDLLSVVSEWENDVTRRRDGSNVVVTSS